MGWHSIRPEEVIKNIENAIAVYREEYRNTAERKFAVGDKARMAEGVDVGFLAKSGQVVVVTTVVTEPNEKFQYLVRKGAGTEFAVKESELEAIEKPAFKVGDRVLVLNHRLALTYGGEFMPQPAVATVTAIGVQKMLVRATFKGAYIEMWVSLEDLVHAPEEPKETLPLKLKVGDRVRSKNLIVGYSKGTEGAITQVRESRYNCLFKPDGRGGIWAGEDELELIVEERPFQKGDQVRTKSESVGVVTKNQTPSGYAYVAVLSDPPRAVWIHKDDLELIEVIEERPFYRGDRVRTKSGIAAVVTEDQKPSGYVHARILATSVGIWLHKDDLELIDKDTEEGENTRESKRGFDVGDLVFLNPSATVPGEIRMIEETAEGIMYHVVVYGRGTFRVRGESLTRMKDDYWLVKGHEALKELDPWIRVEERWFEREVNSPYARCAWGLKKDERHALRDYDRAFFARYNDIHRVIGLAGVAAIQDVLRMMRLEISARAQ